MKYKVLISLGSNKGDRKENLEAAILKISQSLGDIIAVSPIYETPSWGYCDSPYLNNAICLVTNKEPMKLMESLLAIETELGRLRLKSDTYESREIDLDVILIDGVVIDHPKLQVPHPRMNLRKFVLQPLVDIAPSWIHEQSQILLSELLIQCTDESEIELYGTISL